MADIKSTGDGKIYANSDDVKKFLDSKIHLTLDSYIASRELEAPKKPADAPIKAIKTKEEKTAITEKDIEKLEKERMSILAPLAVENAQKLLRSEDTKTKESSAPAKTYEQLLAERDGLLRTLPPTDVTRLPMPVKSRGEPEILSKRR